MDIDSENNQANIAFTVTENTNIKSYMELTIAEGYTIHEFRIVDQSTNLSNFYIQNYDADDWMLNAVLSAIRNVNQLIVRESDPVKLIQHTCQNLIETRGFLAAWIVLIDETGNMIKTAESGLREKFPVFIELFEKGELPYCAQRALKQSNSVVVDHAVSNCTDCPFSQAT